MAMSSRKDSPEEAEGQRTMEPASATLARRISCGLLMGRPKATVSTLWPRQNSECRECLAGPLTRHWEVPVEGDPPRLPVIGVFLAPAHTNGTFLANLNQQQNPKDIDCFLMGCQEFSSQWGYFIKSCKLSLSFQHSRRLRKEDCEFGLSLSNWVT